MEEASLFDAIPTYEPTTLLTVGRARGFLIYVPQELYVSLFFSQGRSVLLLRWRCLLQTHFCNILKWYVNGAYYIPQFFLQRSCWHERDLLLSIAHFKSSLFSHLLEIDDVAYAVGHILINFYITQQVDRCSILSIFAITLVTTSNYSGLLSGQWYI